MSWIPSGGPSPPAPPAAPAPASPAPGPGSLRRHFDGQLRQFDLRLVSHRIMLGEPGQRARNRLGGTTAGAQHTDQRRAASAGEVSLSFEVVVRRSTRDIQEVPDRRERRYLRLPAHAASPSRARQNPGVLTPWGISKKRLTGTSR